MKYLICFLLLFKGSLSISQNINSGNVLSQDILVTYAGISNEGFLSTEVIKRTKFLSIKNDSLDRYSIKSFNIGGCCLGSYVSYKIDGNKIKQEMIDFIVSCNDPKYIFIITKIILVDMISNIEYEYENDITIHKKK